MEKMFLFRKEYFFTLTRLLDDKSFTVEQLLYNVKYILYCLVKYGCYGTKENKPQLPVPYVAILELFYKCIDEDNAKLRAAGLLDDEGKEG